MKVINCRGGKVKLVELVTTEKSKMIWKIIVEITLGKCR